mgnify:FL=1
MADGIKKSFEESGSPLAVPVSPNVDPTVNPDISIQGLSKLHNEYSLNGIPMKPGERSPYNNIGSAQTAYTVPVPSTLGKSAVAYQGETNRYSNNAPENRSF